jgi:hypothetical protein
MQTALVGRHFSEVEVDMSETKREGRPEQHQEPVQSGAGAGQAFMAQDERLDAGHAERYGAGAHGGSLGAAGADAMHQVGDIGGEAVSTSRNVLRGAIGATEEVGTGLVGGAAHLATDVVHGVADLGFEIRNGATSLIGAVGDIGSAAVNTVAHLLVDVVGGVRQVVSAAVGNHGDTQGEVRGTPPAQRGLQGRQPGGGAEETTRH